MCIDTENESLTGVACAIIKAQLQPFELRSQKSKFDFLRDEGRPTPAIPSLNKTCIEGGRQYVRTFQQKSYERIPWLTGCSKLKKLFCWPCLLFDTSGNGNWTRFGFDFKLSSNLSCATKRHAASQTHKCSAEKLGNYENLCQKLLSETQKKAKKSQLKLGKKKYVSRGTNTIYKVIISDEQIIPSCEEETEIISSIPKDSIIQMILKEKPTICITHDNKERKIIVTKSKLDICNDDTKIKPTPILSNLLTNEQKSNDFCTQSYSEYNWLTACEKQEKFFCWPCLFFNPNTIELNSTGYDDVLEIIIHFQTHDTILDHLNAIKIMNRFKQKKNKDIRAIFQKKDSLISNNDSTTRRLSQVEITLPLTNRVINVYSCQMKLRTDEHSIQELLTNPQQKSWETLAIRELGAPKPKLPNLKNELAQQSFDFTSYDQIDWLTGCEQTNALYCWPCLFCSNRTLKATEWNLIGFREINILLQCALTHNSSHDHIQALEKFMNYESFTGYDEPPSSVSQNTISLVLLPESSINIDNEKNPYDIDQESQTEINPLEIDSLFIPQESEISRPKIDTFFFTKKLEMNSSKEITIFLPNNQNSSKRDSSLLSQESEMNPSKEKTTFLPEELEMNPSMYHVLPTSIDKNVAPKSFVKNLLPTRACRYILSKSLGEDVLPTNVNVNIQVLPKSLAKNSFPTRVDKNVLPERLAENVLPTRDIILPKRVPEVLPKAEFTFSSLELGMNPPKEITTEKSEMNLLNENTIFVPEEHEMNSLKSDSSFCSQDIKSDIDIGKEMIGNDIITYNSSLPDLNQIIDNNDMLISASNSETTSSFQLVISNDIQLATLSDLTQHNEFNIKKETTTKNEVILVPTNSQTITTQNSNHIIEKSIILNQSQEVPLIKIKEETETFKEAETELDSNQMDALESFQEVFIKANIYDESDVVMND